jgi:hypothetical protein
VSCANPHGTTACVAAGASFSCAPSCASGFAACGRAQDGCLTFVASDALACGACGRPCATTNSVALACAGGLCTPSCETPYSDCTRPSSPAPDDGCETNGRLDPGEPDDGCGGQSFSVAKGATAEQSLNRILPAGDADTYSITLLDGTHLCQPGDTLGYSAKVTLAPPQSVPLELRYNLSACDDTWSALTNAVCVTWSGPCSARNDLTVHFQVTGGAGQASSCSPYRLTVENCVGTCPGC